MHRIQNCYYILNFHMYDYFFYYTALQDLTMETELEAVNGRRVRAIEVFAHALRFFREHALKVRPTGWTPECVVFNILSRWKRFIFFDWASQKQRFFTLFQEVKDLSSTVLEGEEIRWVITVPAVWRQPAKQFMREAAYLVGWHAAKPVSSFAFQKSRFALMTVGVLLKAFL